MNLKIGIVILVFWFGLASPSSALAEENIIVVQEVTEEESLQVRDDISIGQFEESDGDAKSDSLEEKKSDNQTQVNSTNPTPVVPKNVDPVLESEIANNPKAATEISEADQPTQVPVSEKKESEPQSLIEPVSEQTSTTEKLVPEKQNNQESKTPPKLLNPEPMPKVAPPSPDVQIFEDAVEITLPSAIVEEDSEKKKNNGAANGKQNQEDPFSPLVVEDVDAPSVSESVEELPPSAFEKTKSKQKNAEGQALVEPNQSISSEEPPIVSIENSASESEASTKKDQLPVASKPELLVPQVEENAGKVPVETGLPEKKEESAKNVAEPSDLEKILSQPFEEDEPDVLELLVPTSKESLRKIDRKASSSGGSFGSFSGSGMVSGARLDFKVEDLKLFKRPEHIKKVYVAENKDIFWPRDRPVWVRLATSPRDDAPNFLLQNLYQDKDNQSKVYQKEGIKLEIPGHQFIRWVNHLTQDETRFKFFADGIPPVSSLRLHDAPIFKGKQHTFYGVGLIGTLTSKDDLSGVKEDFIAIDGNPFRPYTESLKLNVEKNYHLRYYAVDKVGYAAEPGSVSFIVDHTPPVSKYAIKVNHDGDTLSLQTMIYLSSQDALSGVDKIHYHFDNSTKSLVYDAKKGISVKHLPDGQHSLYFDAIDKVKNLEKTHQYAFYLDSTAPEPEHNFTSDLFENDGRQFISRRTRILLKADDDRVVVDNIEYRVNKGDYLEYQKPFAPPINSGKFTISYRSTDHLNNRSVPKVLKLIMDSKPPKTKYKLKGSSYTQGGGVVWITDQTEITLYAKDDLSGVKKIEYQLARNPAIKYNRPIVVDTEGQYLFRYWGTDFVNNREMFTPTLMMVDKTPPEILTIFSIDPVRSIREGGKEIKVYPINTTLFLSAIDNSANVRNLMFSLDGSKMKTYSDIMFFDEPGRHKLTVKAVDNVDNEIIEKSEFIIAEEQ